MQSLHEQNVPALKKPRWDPSQSTNIPANAHARALLPRRYLDAAEQLADSTTHHERHPHCFPHRIRRNRPLIPLYLLFHRHSEFRIFPRLDNAAHWEAVEQTCAVDTRVDDTQDSAAIPAICAGSLAHECFLLKQNADGVPEESSETCDSWEKAVGEWGCRGQIGPHEKSLIAEGNLREEIEHQQQHDLRNSV